MKRRSRAQSSTLFLMELIFSILFFTIASAVCVQFFVKAHLYNVEAQQLDLAVSECSGVAELTAAADGLDACLALIGEQYDATVVEQSEEHASVQIFYDADLAQCEEAQAAYCLGVSWDVTDGMLAAQQQFTDLKHPDKAVYELQTEHYLQRGIR